MKIWKSKRQNPLFVQAKEACHYSHHCHLETTQNVWHIKMHEGESEEERKRYIHRTRTITRRSLGSIQWKRKEATKCAEIYGRQFLKGMRCYLNDEERRLLTGTHVYELWHCVSEWRTDGRTNWLSEWVNEWWCRTGDAAAVAVLSLYMRRERRKGERTGAVGGRVTGRLTSWHRSPCPSDGNGFIGGWAYALGYFPCHRPHLA